jgi:hypothetical protein
MTTPVKRTLIAQQALETSDLLNLRFASRLVGTGTPRKLMVAAPDGPSTDGGKKVRQSIVLAPAKDPTAGTVMVGWLDIAQKRAELRVHSIAEKQFVQRYRQPFDVPKVQYDGLMRDVQSMLSVQDIVVAIVEDVPQGHSDESRATMAEMPAPATSGSSPWLWVAFGGLILVLLGIAAHAMLGS